MSPPLPRRRFLALAGAIGTAALSGCLNTITRRDQNVCSSGYRDVGDVFTNRSIVDYLRYASLTVPQSVSPGEQFVATLTNESTDSLTTLGKPRYMIQRLVDKGTWRNTIGVRDEYEWSSSEQILAPGDELRWEMELSANDFWGPFQRCTIHTAGTYRFIYWGFSDNDTGIALAAPFEIVE